MVMSQSIESTAVVPSRQDSLMRLKTMFALSSLQMAAKTAARLAFFSGDALSVGKGREGFVDTRIGCCSMPFACLLPLATDEELSALDKPFVAECGVAVIVLPWKCEALRVCKRGESWFETGSVLARFEGEGSSSAFGAISGVVEVCREDSAITISI